MSAGDGPIIELKGVDFGYPESPTLMHGLDLEAVCGSMTAVVGPNGSGKTTLLRLMSGQLAPRSGSVRVAGVDPSRCDRRRFAREVAVVGNQPLLGFPYSAIEVVLMGRAPHIEGFRLESAHDLEAARAAMCAAGVETLAERSFDSLSSGERQRVCVARALAQEPRLLLLDEPAAHLDIKQQVLLYELLAELCRQRRMTIVSVLHDLNLAALYFDAVCLLRGGSIRACGAPADVLTYAAIREVFDTDVYVDRNTLTGKLNVLPLPTKRAGAR